MELLDLYALAEREDIMVDCFDLEKRESLSIRDEDGRCYIAIDPMRLRSSVEEKDKLGHEMGHCCTGSFYNRFAACDVRQQHENRADKWEIEALVPREAFFAAVNQGVTELWELAEYFEVTERLMGKAMCWYKYGRLTA